MDQFTQYLMFQKEVTQSTLKIIERYQKGGQTAPSKRTSKISIVKDVLDAAGKPLHVSKIIQIAQQNYNVQLDRDSTVSAILKKAKADKTFIRTAPNTFALKSYTSR